MKLHSHDKAILLDIEAMVASPDFGLVD